MSNDDNWVEDVRRWYFAGARSAAATHVDAAADVDDVGTSYDVPDPALQAHRWGDAPITTDR